ncbi:BsaWI endonuclease [Oscillochloris trichoides DG-6]|uniref:BsaWI endonuclease n=1 Tax=Oscillochloris trichoides DG-6 TaxID=765420 RepID=E1I9Y0_9CHLR|nr:BsaWI family type II restriction enzyme [Oscillochloris trichoides]EFO81982.1 BsaWI endonuclease [Oscillochloris trichoides DG-6]
MDLKEIFGKNVQFKRRQINWTQEDLAEAVGVDTRTISRIETGETATEFTTIEKIASALNIDAYQLFIHPDTPEHINSDLIQKISLRAQELYSENIMLLAKKSGIDIPTTKSRKVSREQSALNRFDKNRNRSLDVLAPIRVEALAKTFATLISNFSTIDRGTIWAILQKTHLHLFSNTLIPSKIIENIISAHQSWAKTSGTAFERFIANHLSNIIPDLTVVKPSDLATLKTKHSIKNIDKLIGRSEDDLMVVYKDINNMYLIGVIQAKTSVRDRIKMDASHSQIMLRAGLWSAHITIDPDNFLGKPKFRELADGVSVLGAVWHGVYKLSSIVSESEGVFDFDKLSTHLPQIIQAVINEKMSPTWRPN